MQDKPQNKKIIHKASRTLIIKSENDISIEGLVGLQNSVKTNNNSNFFVFDTLENSKNAFKFFKSINEKVRFAYYRIFFTMVGLDEKSNYNDIKLEHVKWIIDNSDGDVLYYKQYRNTGKFLGCGDFTIDTKESMDKILNNDNLKNYSFGIYSGINYKYKKNNKVKESIQEVPEFKFQT